MKTDPQYSVDGIYIRDSTGRVVILRGCNLGGDSKTPLVLPDDPFSCDVSFTGRPFPEPEADAHFARLAGWGFTFLRFVLTWEAVEHAGPGLYDEDYLSYVRSILKKAENHGIFVFIDPHQDVWSRWTGGDGAPAWTLEAAGFDLKKITATGAAFTRENQDGESRPMNWGLNYLRYAAATMYTLFFGGNIFAPNRMVDGVPIQDFLQGHFIDAMKHTARRLKDCNAIVGFGILNEPHYGFIGIRHLDSHAPVKSVGGSVPTIFQSMVAASGYPVGIRKFGFAGLLTLPGKHLINIHGESLFRDGFRCPWLEAGVWSEKDGVPAVEKDDYFARFPALSGADDGHGKASERRYRKLDFCEDFLKPFQKKYMEALAQKHEHYIFFAEGVPFESRVNWKPEDLERPDGSRFSVVDAFHWYDGLTLLLKKWRSWLSVDGETRRPIFGAGAVRASIRIQLSRLASSARKDGLPAFLGEFGVPFDLGHGRSFRTGDYSAQEQALGVYYDAIDAALLSSTIWNYSATNTHLNGDGWNTEDLSIFSATTGEGRAVKGFSRPYAMAVAGIPVYMHFDRKKRVFVLEWDAVAGITVIFVPSHWYPEGWRADFAGGNAVLDEKPGEQRLFVQMTETGRVRLSVLPL